MGREKVHVTSEGGPNTRVVLWGTAPPLRVHSFSTAGNTLIRAYGTATVAGAEPDEMTLPRIREGIIAALGVVLTELDRPPSELPGLCLETAQRTLPGARAKLSTLGIDLRALTIEGLAVADSAEGERQLTPKPRVPDLGIGGMLGMTMFTTPAMPGLSATAPRASAPPELGNLIRARATVPHSAAQYAPNPVLRPYLEWVASGQNIIPWEVIDSYAAEFFHPQVLAPQALLVPLDTDQNRDLSQAEFDALFEACPGWSPSGLALPTRPVPASEALGGHNRVMLLGDTGSGKTLTARAVCAALALSLLDGSQVPGGWSGGIKVPVYVRLAELCRGGALKGPATLQDLWRAVEFSLGEASQHLAVTPLATIADGGLLWVLDGLDELREMALEWTVDGVEALMGSRAADSFWVLTRSEPVVRGTLALSRLARARLLPLDARADNPYLRSVETSRIEAMVRGWYRQAADRGLLSPDKASQTGDLLLRALEEPGLRQIATRPLLLAKMILFQATRDPLPGNAPVFCREAARLLASTWALGHRDYEVLSYDPVTPQHLEAALGWVATVITRRGTPLNGHRVVDRAEVLEELAPLMFGKADLAEATLEVLLRRGGLLTEAAPGKVAFVYEAMVEPCQKLGEIE